ncbi:hypothetical protein GLOIN_2v1589258 [Rhizophagus irregularis DAOM 181602=DAOM 197198]|nr:hypothetical protein GLOIN_2v1589258 [Rhizophagus irregularis DAOM 181602=DAOM 197198]
MPIYIFACSQRSIQNLSRILLCPEFVQFKLSEFYYIQNLSSFLCPEYILNAYTRHILNKFQTNSEYIKILSIIFMSKNWIISRYIKCFLDIF